MLIGCGPHARRVYLPAIKKLRGNYDLNLKVVVELDGQQQAAESAAQMFAPDLILTKPFRNPYKLPVDLEKRLDAAADALQGLIPSHPQFDRSFVFTASIESRQERFQERMRNNPEEVAPDDLMVLRKPEKFMAMETCLVDLAQTAFHATVIDTTELNPAEVCGRIMDEVYGAKGPAGNV